MRTDSSNRHTEPDTDKAEKNVINGMDCKFGITAKLCRSDFLGDGSFEGTTIDDSRFGSRNLFLKSDGLRLEPTNLKLMS